MKGLLCLLIVCVQVAVAQDFLVKVNGERLPYHKVKFKGDSVSITDLNKDHFRISEEEVFGYFDAALNTFYYKKVAVPDIPNIEKPIILPSKDDRIAKYEYVELIEPGQINLYRKMTGYPASSHYRPGPPGTPGTFYTTSGGGTSYLFAERDEDYKNVFIAGGFTNHRDVGFLRTIMGDDPKTLQRLKSGGDALSIDDVTNIIRDYNLRHFQPAKHDSTSQFTARFYCKSRLRDKLKVTINDSLEYKMPENQMPLSISVPGNTLTKVCVNAGEEDKCKLIMFLSYLPPYYEIDLKQKGRTIDIEAKRYWEYKDYMESTLRKLEQKTGE